MIGLVELLFILVAAIVWGVFELRSLRQSPSTKPPPPPPPGEPPP